MHVIWLLGALSAFARAAGPADLPEQTIQEVVVKRGDTLWSIANAYLKDPQKWDELLKYNQLPSSDPTVALPGMTLKVPIKLIKEELRAARLVSVANRVLFRRRDKADWDAAALDMELYRGDALRTLENARARVRFLDAGVLSLDPNSMALIKPPKADYDVKLEAGSVFMGHARVVTASARVTPRTPETQYSATVRPDLSTLVEVYKGRAGVEGAGRTVEVDAGLASEVRLGLAPSVPARIPNLPEFEARAAAFNGEQVRGQARLKVKAGAELALDADADQINKAADVSDLKTMLANLRVGVPISGFRVQASRTRGFEKLVLNRVFDTEERVTANAQNLPPGVYWFRLALIDLLHVEGKLSAPRLFSVNLAQERREIDLKEALVVSKPPGDVRVVSELYQVEGEAKYEELVVTVNGRPVVEDDKGRFSIVIKLRPGPNDVAVKVRRPDGESETVVRQVLYDNGNFGKELEP